jgi:hypothetical protein
MCNVNNCTYFRGNSGYVNTKSVAINLPKMNYVSSLQVTGHLSENTQWILLLYNAMPTLKEHNYLCSLLKVNSISKFPHNLNLFILSGSINCNKHTEGPSQGNP